MIENITKELESKKEELKDKVVIGMLHTGIDKFLTEGMAGVKKEDIKELIKNVDYLALGHIHTRYEDSEYKMYNPGSLECIKITEDPFNKGFYLVSIDKHSKKIETEFKIVKTRNSYSIKINLNEIDSIEINNIEEQIISLINNKLKDIRQTEEKIMLQIKITGTFLNETDINVEEIKLKLREHYNLLYVEILNLVEIKDEMNVELDESMKREDIDKTVMKERIKNSGYKNDDIDTVFNIIERLKEYAIDTKITIDSTEGKEIEDMLYSIAGDNNED